VTTVAFFYDTNNSGADGTPIGGCGTEPEATGGTCAWNTSGVAPGSYYVYGTTSGDGAGATTVYSSGTMTINDAPALSIAEPNGTGDTVTAGTAYNIAYTLTDSDDTITVAFYYDSDAVGFNGTPISGACATAAEGTGVTCAWDTSGMTPGNYYVYGISTTDAFNSAAQAYSPGVITINPNSAATLVVNQPDGAGDTIAGGDSFTVNYDLRRSRSSMTPTTAAPTARQSVVAEPSRKRRAGPVPGIPAAWLRAATTSTERRAVTGRALRRSTRLAR
jgi:hypothetical protein